MVYYLDSSALMRWLLKAPDYFKSFKSWSVSVSSVLLSIECSRTLDRLRLEGMLSDNQLARVRPQLENILASISLVQIDDPIVVRARNPFSTSVKSLDAIHLATVLLWQSEREENLTIISHDDKMVTAAKALGFSVYSEKI